MERRSSRKIMEDAPWAPVFNEQRFTIRSKRMGGDDALYVDPVHIPVHYDAVTVNESMAPHRTIHEAHHHFGWDRSIPPVADRRAGDDARVRVPRRVRRPALGEEHGRRRRRASTSPGSIRSPARSSSTAPSRATRSRSPSTSFRPSGFGWTANIPGFGLLADQFTEPALHIWTLRQGRRWRRPPSRRWARCR